MAPHYPSLTSSMNITRPSSLHRSSACSVNSLQSCIWYASSSKRVPRKSASESVKFFMRRRARKFLRSEIWSILVTLFLQDGPFFAVRLVAIFVFHVRSFLTYFFTFKNFLILIFQTYRIASICFEKDEQEQELQEKVNTMRRISMATPQWAIPLDRKR
jgi:hypothetical protein